MQRTTLKPVILYFSSVLVEEQVLYNAASHEYSKIMSHTLRNLASNINHKIRYEKIYLAFAFFFSLPLSSQAFRSHLQIFLTSTPTRNAHYLNWRNVTASISPLLLHFEFQILFKELYLCNFYNPCTELWMRTLCVLNTVRTLDVPSNQKGKRASMQTWASSTALTFCFWGSAFWQSHVSLGKHITLTKNEDNVLNSNWCSLRVMGLQNKLGAFWFHLFLNPSLEYLDDLTNSLHTWLSAVL